MHVSRQNEDPPIYRYKLQDINLENVTSYRYLGVHITSTLSWNLHIETITCSANRMLGYLRRNFSKAPVSLKLLFYKTLVRPKLEYAAAIWDPSYANLQQTIEIVQNNACRFILSNFNRTASVTSMKSTLSLPCLSLRRKVFRLSLFFKIYNHASIKNELILMPAYRSSRVDHQHKVALTQCRTNAFFIHLFQILPKIGIIFPVTSPRYRTFLCFDKLYVPSFWAMMPHD